MLLKIRQISTRLHVVIFQETTFVDFPMKASYFLHRISLPRSIVHETLQLKKLDISIVLYSCLVQFYLPVVMQLMFYIDSR